MRFDVILVAAASAYVPKALLEWLRPGGKMVAPIAVQAYAQALKLLQNSPQGDIEIRVVLPVAFAPLVNQTFADASMHTQLSQIGLQFPK